MKCRRCDYERELPERGYCKSCLKAVTEAKLVEVDSEAYGPYGFSQTDDNMKDGDFMTWEFQGQTCFGFLFLAWPVQVAGPRNGDLHTYESSERLIAHIIDPKMAEHVNMFDMRTYGED